MNFLVFNTTATSVEIALYKDASCLELRSESYKLASGHLLRHLNEIFSNHRVTLTDIQFIAANVGPGPATTLRTVLALVNGLGYATQKPLIAVHGIEAFLHEYHNPAYTHTFALFNAFCNDVFFAHHDHATNSITMTCMPITTWLAELKQFLKEHPHARIQFIGNGYVVHHAAFTEALGADIIDPTHIPLSASTAAIAQQAQLLFEQQKSTSHIEALYFKAYEPHKKSC